MYPTGLYGSGNLTPVSLHVTTEITNRQEEADRTTWLTAGRWQEWTETATEPQLQELQSAKAWIHKCWWALYASGWLKCEIVLLIGGLFSHVLVKHVRGTCGKVWPVLVFLSAAGGTSGPIVFMPVLMFACVAALGPSRTVAALFKVFKGMLRSGE